MKQFAKPKEHKISTEVTVRSNLKGPPNSDVKQVLEMASNDCKRARDHNTIDIQMDPSKKLPNLSPASPKTP